MSSYSATLTSDRVLGDQHEGGGGGGGGGGGLLELVSSFAT